LSPFNAKLVLKVEISEDLAKFGYKVNMKIRKLDIILYFFWLPM